MEVAAGTLAAQRQAEWEHPPLVIRHSVLTRVTHWLGTLAFIILVMSGLQIFNAAPYLDASDKSDPAHRVLSIGAVGNATGPTAGITQIFGLRLTTTGWLGLTDDGLGGRAMRAFPGWITFPGYQDLADGRRWHLFFAWVMVLAGVAYLIGGALNRDLALLVLRPSDVPKLVPMQLYYLRLRKEPPPYGKYNPLQKAAYTLVLFGFAPLIVLSGLALSPGIDAFLPLVNLFGGRQFARLWHFVFMLALLGFLGVHLVLVASTGAINNLRSMVTGRYRPCGHEGRGA